MDNVHNTKTNEAEGKGNAIEKKIEAKIQVCEKDGEVAPNAKIELNDNLEEKTAKSQENNKEVGEKQEKKEVRKEPLKTMEKDTVGNKQTEGNNDQETVMENKTEKGDNSNLGKVEGEEQEQRGGKEPVEVRGRESEQNKENNDQEIVMGTDDSREEEEESEQAAKKDELEEIENNDSSKVNGERNEHKEAGEELAATGNDTTESERNEEDKLKESELDAKHVEGNAPKKDTGTKGNTPTGNEKNPLVKEVIVNEVKTTEEKKKIKITSKPQLNLAPKCPGCIMKPKNPQELLEHMNRVHRNMVDTKQMNEQKICRCARCGHYWLQSKGHEKDVCDQNSRCRVCQEVPKPSISIVKHMNDKHNEWKIETALMEEMGVTKCDTCDKFATLGGEHLCVNIPLQNKEIEIGNQRKEKKCGICNKTYISERGHKCLRLLKEKAARLTCLQCDDWSCAKTSKRMLCDHLNEKHGRTRHNPEQLETWGIKQCEWCGKTLITLTKHTKDCLVKKQKEEQDKQKSRQSTMEKASKTAEEAKEKKTMFEGKSGENKKQENGAIGEEKDKNTNNKQKEKGGQRIQDKEVERKSGHSPMVIENEPNQTEVQSNRQASENALITIGVAPMLQEKTVREREEHSRRY